MATCNVRVPDKSYDRLANRASQLGVSQYYIIKCLVDSYLADPESFIVPIPVETTQVIFPP